MKKNILIIGGTGTLGTALINNYVQTNNIYCVSRDECKQWELRKTINNSNLNLIIGDMRDYNKMKSVITQIKPDVILIVGAMKHIDICENNIQECIKTNILGVNNILDISNKLDNIKTVCFISTDKACNPSNVYGMCKAISEKMVISMQSSNTKYMCVRYGNVLNSRGSIIHYLRNFQNINNYELTHKDMTRYVMSLEQSVKLIDYAINNCENGDIVIPKLKSIKIKDLIELYAEKYNKEITISGIRYGEKLYESLISEHEIKNVKLQDDYCIIRKNYENQLNYNDQDIINNISSNNNLINKDELLKILKELQLI